MEEVRVLTTNAHIVKRTEDRFLPKRKLKKGELQAKREEEQPETIIVHKQRPKRLFFMSEKHIPEHRVLLCPETQSYESYNHMKFSRLAQKQANQMARKDEVLILAAGGQYERVLVRRPGVRQKELLDVNHIT